MGLAASRQEAFWEACGFGNLERARKLLAEGDIDVNWVSYTNDCCPIHVASQGKPDIVQLLLDNSCDVNVRDIRGNTALHHAAMKGHADIIQMLIDAGVEKDAQEKNDWTALHNAAYWCHPEAVRVLIRNGCDVSLQNKDERTALHETARSQQNKDDLLGEIARMLIDAGSDINSRSSDLGEADLTGLMYAAYHNHPDVALALVGAGCELDAVGTTFWTALHWAADRGHDEIVYILLEAGADPLKKGMRGELAVDRAKSDEIREVLLNAVNMHREMLALKFKESSAKKVVKPAPVNQPILQPVPVPKKTFCWDRPTEGSGVVLGRKILGDIIPVRPRLQPGDDVKSPSDKFRLEVAKAASRDISLSGNDSVGTGKREVTPVESVSSREATLSSIHSGSSTASKEVPTTSETVEESGNCAGAPQQGVVDVCGCVPESHRLHHGDSTESGGDTSRPSPNRESPTEESVCHRFDTVSDKTANKISDEIANQTADEIADKIAEEIVGKIADQTADEIADKMADEIADKMADDIADKMADEIADKMADDIADKMADDIADKMADELADKMADEIADKIADEH